MSEGDSYSRRFNLLEDRPEARYNSINAGLGGYGGGATVVAIAQQVGVDTAFGKVLVFLAPAVTIVAGAALFQLKLWTDWRNEKSRVKRARKTLERHLDYPHTSDDHKEQTRRLLEELDHFEAENEIARVKSGEAAGDE